MNFHGAERTLNLLFAPVARPFLRFPGIYHRPLPLHLGLDKGLTPTYGMR